MFFDIGGWWLTCDDMFRRFGTPFASDWIAKNINGYLYTAAIPAAPGSTVEGVEFGNRYAPRTPVDDPEYSEKIGSYLDAVLPTYGAHFADWWADRLVPEQLEAAVPVVEAPVPVVEAAVERLDVKKQIFAADPGRGLGFSGSFRSLSPGETAAQPEIPASNQKKR